MKSHQACDVSAVCAVQVYVREAVALQCLAREAEAMVSYAAGLVHEPNNKQLLHGLVNAAAQSNIKRKFTVQSSALVAAVCLWNFVHVVLPILSVYIHVYSKFRIHKLLRYDMIEWN